MDQMRAFNEMLLHFMNATESPLPCISRRGGVSDDMSVPLLQLLLPSSQRMRSRTENK